MDERTSDAVEWLLGSDEPAIRLLTRRDVLGAPIDIAAEAAAITSGPIVTARLAEALISWQWPDGGWNCDLKATGRRSSFNETLGPAWGLHEYATSTGHAGAREAAERAAELFLEHRLFRALRTDEVIKTQWLKPRYPPYWHYDILQVLLVLSRMGMATDPRATDALDELERRRLPDGRWRAEGRWWRPSDSSVTPEVVEWDRPGEPNRMLTLNALRVLTAAGWIGPRSAP